MQNQTGCTVSLNYDSRRMDCSAPWPAYYVWFRAVIKSHLYMKNTFKRVDNVFGTKFQLGHYLLQAKVAQGSPLNWHKKCTLVIFLFRFRPHTGALSAPIQI